MRKIKTFLLILMWCYSAQCFGQEANDFLLDSLKSPEVIQFSGVLVTGDSLLPVPYSNVYRKRDNTGVISNVLGFFTLPAFEGDTIVFSNVGYRNVSYVIPEELGNKMHSIVQLIVPETIRLANVNIYPWPSRSAFKNDFLALELGEDNLARLLRNLDPLEMKKRIAFLGPDGSSSASFAMNRESLRLQSMGTAQNISLMNPFAWAKFISALKNGDLGRQ